MRLEAIEQSNFSIWKSLREKLYGSIEDPFNEIEMEKIFNSDDWHCRFIRDESGNILGFVELSLRNIVDGCLSSPVVYLEGLYLKPEFRGKGLGTEIMNNIISWCLEQGYSELATDTELTNTRAQAFYQALGFEETDRVVEFRLQLVDDSDLIIE